MGLKDTFTKYWPFLTINFVFSLSKPEAAIEGFFPLPKLIDSAVILYSPSFKALTSWATVAGSSAFGAVVAGAVDDVVAEFAAGVAAGFVVVGFVSEVVELFATIGVSSAAKAKLSWSYASIAATAENIAVADKTFNSVVFFILEIFSFVLYIIRY